MTDGDDNIVPMTDDKASLREARELVSALGNVATAKGEMIRQCDADLIKRAAAFIERTAATEEISMSTVSEEAVERALAEYTQRPWNDAYGYMFTVDERRRMRAALLAALQP